MSQGNSDADSNPSGVPRGTSVFREPEVWIVFPVERVAAEIEQPNASMPWVQDQKTVPRGTECGRRCFAHHLVFEVPCVPCGTMWSPIVTKFVQEFFCST